MCITVFLHLGPQCVSSRSFFLCQPPRGQLIPFSSAECVEDLMFFVYWGNNLSSLKELKAVCLCLGPLLLVHTNWTLTHSMLYMVYKNSNVTFMINWYHVKLLMSTWNWAGEINTVLSWFWWERLQGWEVVKCKTILPALSYLIMLNTFSSWLIPSTDDSQTFWTVAFLKQLNLICVTDRNSNNL